MKYRKLPVVIEAVQLTRTAQVQTLEGTMTGCPGDWMITGVEGEHYFCKDSIFQKTYEPVPEAEARCGCPTTNASALHWDAAEKMWRFENGVPLRPWPWLYCPTCGYKILEGRAVKPLSCGDPCKNHCAECRAQSDAKVAAALQRAEEAEKTAKEYQYDSEENRAAARDWQAEAEKQQQRAEEAEAKCAELEANFSEVSRNVPRLLMERDGLEELARAHGWRIPDAPSVEDVKPQPDKVSRATIEYIQEVCVTADFDRLTTNTALGLNAILHAALIGLDNKEATT